jgi:3-phenylpropionate/trans-cinnamate dioxygenase ferredoxin reductase component
VSTPATGGMVIVGAGECGARAAASLREQGYEGPLTLIGAEGHAPYERPPLSKDALASAEALPKTILSHETLTAIGVDWLSSSEVVAVDRVVRTARLADGRDIPYDKLLLATGASPRRAPLAEKVPRCVYLRTLDDVAALGARLRDGVRVAVIGGDFIGLELAAAARKHGCSVTVVETQPCILMRGCRPNSPQSSKRNTKPMR